MYKGKTYKDYEIMVDTEGTERAMGDPVKKKKMNTELECRILVVCTALNWTNCLI
jgi:hypothetical protein